MGVWGAGLYQNDTGMDTKLQLVDLLRKGKTAEEAINILRENFYGIEAEPYEACCFWLAAADCLWDRGLLTEPIKAEALRYIALQVPMPPFRPVTRSANKQRNAVLEKLQNKLNSPQPKPKTYVAPKIYHCRWQIGDVYAIAVKSDENRAQELYRRYLLIQKVGEAVWHPGHTVPIVYVKITKDAQLPSNTAEYSKLEYIQTAFTRYEDRFWPIDGRCPREDIAKKMLIHYQTDDHGHLPGFRIKLLNTSERVIPKDLVYVGNFSSAAPPKGEFIPHSDINLPAIGWKNNRGISEFENKMIDRYFNYNKRQSPAYQTKNTVPSTPDELPEMVKILLQVLDE